VRFKMLIQADQSLLLLVDVQARLLPAMAAPEAAVAGCAKLLTAAARLGVQVVASEQYPKGLGPTVPELAARVPAGATLTKVTFSCADEPALESRIAASGRRTIVVCGIEAHVCVLQSAIGFRARGYDVAVAWDATSSRRESDRDLAAHRLRQAGVVVAGVEMVLFEWLGRAGTPEFKEISALIK
jgi:nicotinamidase-related amidase